MLSCCRVGFFQSLAFPFLFHFILLVSKNVLTKSKSSFSGPLVPRRLNEIPEHFTRWQCNLPWQSAAFAVSFNW